VEVDAVLYLPKEEDKQKRRKQVVVPPVLAGGGGRGDGCRVLTDTS
jgi:hypothetical protein